MFPFHVWAAVQQVGNEFFIVGRHLWRARMQQISRWAAAFFRADFYTERPFGGLACLATTDLRPSCLRSADGRDTGSCNGRIRCSVPSP